MERTIINKTMEREDLDKPEVSSVSDELNGLIGELRAHALPVSAWSGRLKTPWFLRQKSMANRGYGYEPLPGAIDDFDFPWFLYWEISWVWTNSGLSPGDRVLDLGGTGSLFSFYLASKGLEVTTVDINPALKQSADEVAARMGWKLRNHVMDMREMRLPEGFDHIASICVYEHIPLEDRIGINKCVRELLAPGGRFSVTFDYRNPSSKVGIDSPDDVRRQFIEPSGLKVRGNEEFVDTGKNYLLHPFHSNRWGLNIPWKLEHVLRREFSAREFFSVRGENEYTFGALFLEK